MNKRNKMSEWDAKTIVDTLSPEDLVLLYEERWTGSRIDFSFLYKVSKRNFTRYMIGRSKEMFFSQRVKVVKALKEWANEFPDSVIREFKLKSALRAFKDKDSITGGIFLYDF